jgi:hypothetical protein
LLRGCAKPKRISKEPLLGCARQAPRQLPPETLTFREPVAAWLPYLQLGHMLCALLHRNLLVPDVLLPRIQGGAQVSHLLL